MIKKSKRSGSTDKSQNSFDYGRIEKLREEAWARPQVRKNWEEFHRKQNNKK